MKTSSYFVSVVVLLFFATGTSAAVIFETSGQDDPTSNGFTFDSDGSTAGITTSFGTDEDDYWRIESLSPTIDAQYVGDLTSADVTDPTGWTATVRVKANIAAVTYSFRHRVFDDVDYWGMEIHDGDGDRSMGVHAMVTPPDWSVESISGIDPTDGYHTYQLIYDPDADQTTYYIDGQAVSVKTRTEVTDYTGLVAFVFGTSSGPADWQLSLARFETGQHPFDPIVTAPLPGDANDDGIVNDEDAMIMAGNWQQTIAGGSSVGDFDGDGVVDDVDATILATNWQVSAPSAAVPEPSTLAMLLMGATSFVAMWYRRAKRS